MSNLAHAFPNSYDMAYDLAEQKEAARQEARDQIITAYRDGKAVRFSSKKTVTADDAICDWMVIPDEDLDEFILSQSE